MNNNDMTLLRVRLLRIGFLFLLLPGGDSLAQQTAPQQATYRVTFIGLWSEDDSTSYPLSAHFTDLVGTTHRSGEPLWRSGGFATNGVEDVAELGSTGVLRSEIESAQNNDRAGPIVSLDSLFNLPNSSSTTINVTSDFPNISLISMVAPSPDWFVGVSDLSLRDGEQWRPSFAVDLHPYDAGTEEGNGFSLGNPATSPQQPISLLTNSPFIAANPVIARLSFELLNPTPPPPSDPREPVITPVINFLLD